MVKENKIGQMVLAMKENGKIIKQMVMENIIMLMAICMKANLKMIWLMDMGFIKQ